MARSKLRMALAAEKGVDFKKLKQQKKLKDARRRQRSNQEFQNGETTHDAAAGEDLAQATVQLKDQTTKRRKNLEKSGGIGTQDGTASMKSNQRGDDCDEDHSENATAISLPDRETLNKNDTARTQQSPDDGEKSQSDNEEDEEDIPLSDLESIDEELDLIPHTRLTINNTLALKTACERICIPTDQAATFASHQSIVSSEAIADAIPDVSDDLARELAFYSQSLKAVCDGRSRLLAEGVPFSRPKDYFAEMIKEDAHMEKIKAKLMEEAAAKRAAADARRQRDLKKFGKQVQVAKLQERQKEKRETLNKIKMLKRKRQESDLNTTNEPDLFDVAVDDLGGSKKQRMNDFNHQPQNKRSVNTKRQKKDEKYGFGGKKRGMKSGDAVSSGDLSGFSVRRNRARDGQSAPRKPSKATRPGKARRKSMGGR